jgi:hypothetical protein
MRALVLAICAVAALALLTARAEADPADGPAGMSMLEKARFLADRGRQLQRDGKFAEALEAYKAAYVLAPSPGLLFNLAQAYRLNGDCDDAAWMYRRFLETEPRDDLRDLVNGHLQKLAACMHAGFGIEPPAVPNAQSKLQEPSQPPRIVAVAVVPEHDGERDKRVGSYLMIGGAVALAASAVFAIDAHEVAGDVQNAYHGGARNPDVRALDDRGQRDSTIATITGVTGGVAVVSGAVLYGLGRHYESAQHLAVVPHRDGGEVRVAWQF